VDQEILLQDNLAQRIRVQDNSIDKNVPPELQMVIRIGHNSCSRADSRDHSTYNTSTQRPFRDPSHLEYATVDSKQFGQKLSLPSDSRGYWQLLRQPVR
jgi:hypothetical protein